MPTASVTLAFTVGSFGDIDAILQLAWQIRAVHDEAAGARAEIRALGDDVDVYKRALQGIQSYVECRRKNLHPGVGAALSRFRNALFASAADASTPNGETAEGPANGVAGPAPPPPPPPPASTPAPAGAATQTPAAAAPAVAAPAAAAAPAPATPANTASAPPLSTPATGSAGRPRRQRSSRNATVAENQDREIVGILDRVADVESTLLKIRRDADSERKHAKTFRDDIARETSSLRDDLQRREAEPQGTAARVSTLENSVHTMEQQLRTLLAIQQRIAELEKTSHEQLQMLVDMQEKLRRVERDSADRYNDFAAFVDPDTHPDVDSLEYRLSDIC
ncbi:hypothetical protein AURDEDRAFT_187864 [Auricularia subglabra TFB-10046 SS5]|nr:hypothetical protein AURDEDRAFT_187864 [Auricularia subglabra TFB-10046 SS5]